MTTTDTLPCLDRPTCHHKLCHMCDQPMRSYGRASEHRGTKQMRAKGLCQECYRAAEHHPPEARPGASGPLSDGFLAWLRTEHPHAYRYHTDRRRRGVPPEGYRVRGER